MDGNYSLENDIEEIVVDSDNLEKVNIAVKKFETENLKLTNIEEIDLKQKEKNKSELLIKLFNKIGCDVNNIKDLYDITLEQANLKTVHVISILYKMIKELKQEYNSEALTCLHKNSITKQKFPAVNMLRQILKCNNLKLKPFTVSRGYDKSNGKKIVDRYYNIIPL